MRRRLVTGLIGSLAVGGMLVAASPAAAAGTTLTTQVTPASMALGGSFNDKATVSVAAGAAPTGAVTFRVYGPADTTCTAAPVFTSSNVALTPGAGTSSTATSSSFIPTAPGAYRVIASYTSDAPASFSDSAGACNDANETVTVTKATPTIATVASVANYSNGNYIFDTATVSGRVGATTAGTVTFQLYGPDDAFCSRGAIYTSTVAYPQANGSVQSNSYFAASQNGTYRWVAGYSGDANNNPVTGACNDPNESVFINRSGVTLTTRASLSGTTASDTATISNGYFPSGTITFQLYGPNDTNCVKGAIATTSRFVQGNGTYVSDSTSGLAPGTYNYVAYYGGDGSNFPASGFCGDTTEQVTVPVPTPPATTPPATTPPASTPPATTTTPPATTAPPAATTPKTPVVAPPTPAPVASGPRVICASVPSVLRHTLKGVLHILKSAGCGGVKVKHTGHGRKPPSHVKSQGAEPGTKLYTDQPLTIVLG